MNNNEQEKGKQQGYLELGLIQQFVMHMLIASDSAIPPDVVLYPYVSKDEIASVQPPIHIDVHQFLDVCIERRTRSILIEIHDENNDTERRKAILLGEKEVSRFIMDLQYLLRELRRIPITIGERFP